ncbi:lipopolysaccharide transport periplasmic protein LptA [Gallaecimonas sp. GXIMD4217]|uniref:lipopolysaccharide transport periplasmic protein LptA n=1 Tax=Gallaecimonas sp. GXIMD4217 TaxID=3131927 RepID=UPI00311B36FB
MNKTFQYLALFASLLGPMLAQAGEDDFRQKIAVNAQNWDADGKRQRLIYRGKVDIRQGSLHIQADSAEVINREDTKIFITKGQPARFQQRLDSGELVRAQANTITYDNQKRLLVMEGDAQIEQQGSLAKGDRIQYDLNAQRLIAEAKGEDARVTTIFDPAPQPEQPEPEQEQQEPEQEEQEGGN